MKLAFEAEIEADLTGLVAPADEAETTASRRFSSEGKRVKRPALSKTETWRMKNGE